MEIKTFGKITEIIDRNVEILFPIQIVELRKVLEDNFPKLQQMEYKIAVDDELINDESETIQQPKSIAVLPPFSGG